MIVGVPKEIKPDEYRVAMVPAGVEELTRAGHKVLVETGAGSGSGISDEMYAANGAESVAATADIWRRSEMIVKVKEPRQDEGRLVRPGKKQVGYFHYDRRHLAAVGDEREDQGADAGRVAADAAEPDGVHLLPLRRRREPDPGGDGLRHHRGGLRDDQGREGRAAAAHPDERGRGPHE